jgi:hypothetical protein
LCCIPIETMACTKGELVSAINSYAAARLTNDAPLTKMAAEKLQAIVETLDFAPEPVEAEEPESDGE